MKSSTKVILALGGVTAATGGLVWYLSDPRFAGVGGGGGGGRGFHGFHPGFFWGGSSGRSSGGSSSHSTSPSAGTTHGGFGTTSHAVSS